MRLAAVVCAVAVVAGVTTAGVVLSQKISVTVSNPAPAVASPAPAAKGPVVAVRTVSEVSPEPAPVAAAAVVSTPPAAPAQSAAPSAATTGQSAPSAPQEAASPAIVTAQVTGATPPPAAPAVVCPGNPNALGVSRTVEIDTTGGPGFGFEHFKSHDFLRDGEVVLTFDDGPWPKTTQAVLAALKAHCTKAIFFPIGLHATYEPAILKQVAAEGHAIGSHTFCHQNLSKTKGTCLIHGKRQAWEYDPKDEIEKGISAVRWAVGGPTAPFFRFPALKQPPELIEYLGKRNIAIFSTDFDSFDFKMRKPEQVRKSVMERLKKYGKGIALMHDFQHPTADALAGLLDDLKAGGYKIVFMRPKFPVQTIATYDETIAKLVRQPGGDGRPTSSVVRDVN
jgi:peptidoglycan/xylan/chitin deacetylase (PgdA/CDA1 family)